MCRENKKQENIFGEISLVPPCSQMPPASSAFQGPPIAAITLQLPQGQSPQVGSPPLTCLQTCFPANSCTARSAFLPLRGRRKGKAFGDLSLGLVSPITSGGKLHSTSHNFVLGQGAQAISQNNTSQGHRQFRGEAAAVSLLPPLHGR